MLRKIISVFGLLVLAGVLCSATLRTMSAKTKAAVKNPPRTINVNARLEMCLTSQTANVYVRVNGGTWTLVNSVPSTTCTNIGSFSATDGDLIEFTVIDAANPGWYAEYRAVSGSNCPRPLNTRFCGDGGSLGTVFSATLVSTVSTYSVQVSYDYIQMPQPSPCKNLLIC